MKTILFLISRDFFSIQGAAEPYYTYHFLRKHYKVILIAPVSRPVQEESSIYPIPPQRRLWWKWVPFWLYCDLQALRQVKRIRLSAEDIIWSYHGFLITPLWLRWRYKCRWIIDFRSPPVEQVLEFYRVRGRLLLMRKLYYLVTKRIYRAILPFVHTVIAVSPMLKDLLVQDYGVAESKIYVQPLGVDLQLFVNTNRRAFDERAPRLVYVSSLAKQRGVDCLLSALRLLQERNIYPHLMLVGTGPAEDIRWMELLAEKEGVSEQVEFLEFVPHEQIPRVLEECDIGVSPLPDLFSYRVSSPTKVFEYLAMGMVVIASDLPAHRVIIRHEENGLLVPPCDPKAWADAIERVCKDAALRQRLQDQARESVKQYDWGYMLSQLNEKVIQSHT